MREYSLPLSLALAGALVGCATSQPKGMQKEDFDAMRAQLTEMRTLIVNQGSRLESIETRVGTISDKVANSQSNIDNLMANRKPMPAQVSSHPSEGAGTEPQEILASLDPEAGFVNDGAIQDYRKGEILFEAQKFPEAVLAFSSFVEKYPDHPLAGSAQYSIGEAYFKRKEYKLALHEFERVLTSYDRSPHISDTLRELAETEDALKMPEQAARHRQLLTSLFAQAPAASFSPANAPKALEHGTAPTSGNSPTASPHLDEPPAAATSHAELPTAPLTAPLSSEAHEVR